MNIRSIKCPSCGKVGTIRQYEKNVRDYNSVEYKLIPLEKSCLETYARLVCTDCCFTFGYWPQIKDIFAEEQKVINSKKKYLDYISRCEETTVKIYREWYSKVIKAITPKLSAACSFAKEKNRDFDELTKKWNEVLTCENSKIFKIKLSPFVISEKTGQFEFKQNNGRGVFSINDKDTFNKQYQDIYLKMNELDKKVTHYSMYRQTVFAAEDLETLCKYQATLFLLRNKKELTNSRFVASLSNVFGVDCSKEVKDANEFILNYPIPDFKF